ncbi:cell division protein FtsQ/DivIB [Micromonospora pisi]|uniref:cell division protein FtsQ/DivIB n=1 Tax=Micromonospora pisi TaxID=589240 RepID=UPI001FE29827|nr:FtsQ-type POTRA domain-containing protein [Micromonospora pisi]
MVRAGSDAVPPSARRFMRRARQRQLRAVLPWAIAGGVLALAGLVSWVVYGTSLLGVGEVRVTGTDLVSPEQVREAAAVPDGQPLARVDLAAVGDRVGALAPVERATVSRHWPGALLIEVVERTPAAVVPQGRQFAVVDRAGVVFRTVAQRPAGLPLVQVPGPGRDDPATRAALQVLGALTPQLREGLVEVAVEGPARILVRLADDRTVVWGDATESDKKASVATALLGQRTDTIDVSSPDVVTIR